MEKVSHIVPLRLKKAYLDLAEKIPQPLIQVQQITKQAGVSRSSFYFHYENLSDFRKDLENELLSSIFTLLEQCILCEKDIYRSYYKLFPYAQIKSKALKVVRFMPDSTILERLREYLTDLNRIQTEKHNNHQSAFSLFCASTALINSIMPTETKPCFSPEELTTGILCYFSLLTNIESL